MTDSKPLEIHLEVTLALPCDLPLPDGDYVCRRARDAWTVRLERVDPAPSEGSSHRFSTAMDGRVGETAGATFEGSHRHSLATVKFRVLGIDGPCDNPLEDLAHGNLVIERARTCLNYFLDWFRILSQDLTVRPLTRLEFYSVRHGRGLSPSWTLRHSETEWSKSGGVNFGPYPATLGAPEVSPPELVERLNLMLGAGTPPRLPDLLFLDAEVRLRTGDRRFSVIDANTAAELLIEDVAVRLLVQDGMTAEEARAKVVNTPHRTILETLVTPRLKLEQPIPIEDFKQARELRNSVVHEGYEPTDVEAESTLSSIADLATRLLNGAKERRTT